MKVGVSKTKSTNEPRKIDGPSDVVIMDIEKGKKPLGGASTIIPNPRGLFGHGKRSSQITKNNTSIQAPTKKIFNESSFLSDGMDIDKPEPKATNTTTTSLPKNMTVPSATTAIPTKPPTIPPTKPGRPLTVEEIVGVNNRSTSTLTTSRHSQPPHNKELQSLKVRAAVEEQMMKEDVHDNFVIVKNQRNNKAFGKLIERADLTISTLDDMTDMTHKTNASMEEICASSEQLRDVRSTTETLSKAGCYQGVDKRGVGVGVVVVVGEE
ncbi:hypothetical protein SAMD00019534_063410 [Acytostelium subglobosum LB1]|uniref:hypothetical protein n=1 Tax=Acytostelium subglobosum LB1 TaxID=1410327 RepID=UPI000644F97B|nr:hypothetical protein SAMD00019534_063410 [Acytostelium subglobosum LB1]GAM23166.1 hypothetical protein SAMD00019534_063410 [Acytostelium subglobosum LB1]|eukprot:XP_012753615.1 hypothetical protein SAMD00019534_063410 [Acytostelium subglobosum LB1]